MVRLLKQSGYRVICIDQNPVHGSRILWNHIDREGNPMNFVKHIEPSYRRHQGRGDTAATGVNAMGRGPRARDIRALWRLVRRPLLLRVCEEIGTALREDTSHLALSRGPSAH